MVCGILKISDLCIVMHKVKRTCLPYASLRIKPDYFMGLLCTLSAGCTFAYLTMMSYKVNVLSEVQNFPDINP